MKKLAIGFGIVLLAAVLVVPVFGHGPDWGRDKGSGWGHGYCTSRGYGSGQGGPLAGYGLSALNLTDEQSARIKSLHEKYYREVAPLKTELLIKRAELQLLWVQKSSDKKAILAKQKDINTLHGQINEKKTNLRFEMREVLTPEQQATLDLMGSGRNMGPRDGVGYGWCESIGPRADSAYHHGRSMGW